MIKHEDIKDEQACIVIKLNKGIESFTVETYLKCINLIYLEVLVNAAVKWLFHTIILINTAKTKPFTPVNSLCLVNNSGSW